jgi:hypothetical protein
MDFPFAFFLIFLCSLRHSHSQNHFPSFAFLVCKKNKGKIKIKFSYAAGNWIKLLAKNFPSFTLHFKVIQFSCFHEFSFSKTFCSLRFHRRETENFTSVLMSGSMKTEQTCFSLFSHFRIFSYGKVFGFSSCSIIASGKMFIICFVYAESLTQFSLIFIKSNWQFRYKQITKSN